MLPSFTSRSACCAADCDVSCSLSPGTTTIISGLFPFSACMASCTYYQLSGASLAYAFPVLSSLTIILVRPMHRLLTCLRAWCMPGTCESMMRCQACTFNVLPNPPYLENPACLKQSVLEMQTAPLASKTCTYECMNRQQMSGLPLLSLPCHLPCTWQMWSLPLLSRQEPGSEEPAGRVSRYEYLLWSMCLTQTM